MARTIEDKTLKTRTSRLALALNDRPYWTQISKGLSLGYRRIAGPKAPWIVRSTVGGKQWQKAIAIADDYEERNGETVLDFFQAQAKARQIARGENGRSDSDSSPPLSVGEAIEAYRLDLRSRQKSEANADQALVHLRGSSMLAKPVSALTVRELELYRNGLLAKGLVNDSVNRTICPLRAALRWAAERDERITNHSAWNVGLKKLPASGGTRNHMVITDPAMMRRLIEASYEHSLEFGLLIELAAQTGARYSQLARIRVLDLQLARSRIMVPTSKKGRATKAKPAAAVPITAALAAKLAAAAAGRAADAPLLGKPEGSDRDRWGPKHQCKLFAAVAQKLGLRDGSGQLFTMYALRHSSITRQLLANTPIRIVAALHDTSVAMIEKTYSAHISDHGDALFRNGLAELDTSTTNVLPIAA